MSYDYNEDQVQYIGFRQQAGLVPSGYVADQGVLFVQDILQRVAAEANGKPEDLLKYLGAISGCLHQLEAFMSQTERLVEHLQALNALANINQIYPVMIFKRGPEAAADLTPPAMVQIGVDRVEYDFVLLLLMGVAALERLASFASEEILADKCNFYNLKRRLAASNDQRSGLIVPCIDNVLPKIGNVLVTETKKSLRNRLAHLSSVPEMTRSAMTFHLLENGRTLRFDHQVDDCPMFKTVYDISSAVPYLITSVCGIMLAHCHIGGLTANHNELLNVSESMFNPTWENTTIVYNDYVDQTGQGQRVSIYKPEMAGFRVHTEHLIDDVFDKAT